MMRNKWARGLVWRSLALLVATGFVVSGSAQAATSKPLNLVTSPLPINLVADPGKAVATDIRVKQNSGDNETLKVSLMKFAAFGDEGKPRLLDRGPGDDYFDWVKFDKTTFAAPNNVWQTVKMTINLPKTAAFGYYYAVVFSRQGDDVTSGTGNTNALNGGSAVLVLLDANVPGATRQVAVDSFVSDHGVFEFLPATFSVRLHNTGNVHVVPHGNIFIMKGKKQIAALNLNDEQGNILPNSHRVYPVEWNDSYPHYEKVTQDGKVKLDKNHQPLMKLVWANPPGQKDTKPHLRMGKYTAHLFAVYDDGQRDVPIEADVSFWVIPWRLLLGALVVLLLVGAGTYSVTRGTWRRVAGWFARFKRS
jgi:hypothetical protein